MSAGVFHIVVAASADIFAFIVVPVAVFCMFARADSTKSTRITNKTNERTDGKIASLYSALHAYLNKLEQVAWLGTECTSAVHSGSTALTVRHITFTFRSYVVVYSERIV